MLLEGPTPEQEVPKAKAPTRRAKLRRTAARIKPVKINQLQPIFQKLLEKVDSELPSDIVAQALAHSKRLKKAEKNRDRLQKKEEQAYVEYKKTEAIVTSLYTTAVEMKQEIEDQEAIAMIMELLEALEDA